MKSWYSIRAAASGAAEVLIYDEIGLWGVSARQFIGDLQALGEVQQLTLRINSPGGDVFDGWAIFNALKRHAAHKTVWIDGIAASMASVVALAGDEIVMPDNAMLMIHEPMQLVAGTSGELRQAADTLDKVAEGLVRAYAERSGQSEDDVRQMMAAETWLSAAEAVELGFADRLDEPVKMAARFDLSRFRRVPSALAADEETSRNTLEGGGGEGQKNEGDGAAGQASPENPGADPAAAEPGAQAEATVPPHDGPFDPGPEVSAETPAPEATPTAPQATADAGAVEARARSEALAYAGTVADLCALAGMPKLTGAFIARNVPLEEVRAQLLRARAEDDGEAEIDGSRGAPRGFQVQSAWGNVIDRVNGR